MHIVSASEMRLLDRYTIDEVGIPTLVLMENAGRETARRVEAMFPDRSLSWLILAGKGNNGADGLVCARHLQDAGYPVHLLYAEPPERLTGEASIQRDIARRLGIPASVYQEQPVHWQQYSGVIDALLGTGTKGQPREPYASLIRVANESGLPIVSVDLPSGLDADTGQLYEPCVQADLTVCLAFLKRGLAQYPGIEAGGEIVVAPIGIPASLADQFDVQTFLLTEHTLSERLKVSQRNQRKMDSHKGTYGHVLVVAGTRRMSGAGILCATAALRTGCGLVTWAVPDRLVEHLLGRVPEVMLAGIPDQGRGDWQATAAQDLVPLIKDRDALVIGPGMGQFAKGSDWIRTLWDTACPLVVDADGLNMIADCFATWPKRQAHTVFTPHPGEMARLMKLSVREVQSDRIEIARQFAGRYGVTLVLKGARTVIAAPDGTVYINPTGNPGMATGGSGDVLAGMVASLLAQGHDATQAGCLGAYLHGKAGDAAAEQLGQHALLASDLLNAIRIH